MASSDFSKMTVVNLRRELKARNLSTSGDKSELIARLQSSSTKDEDNLSDELGSDIALDEEVDKDNLAEYQIESESPVSQLAPTTDVVQNAFKPRLLKRKQHLLATDFDQIAEDKLLSPESPTTPSILHTLQNNGSSAKKIVLQRVPSSGKQDDVGKNTVAELEMKNIKLDDDPRIRLEMRAKRFGLPMNDVSRKEARKKRFGNEVATFEVATGPTKLQEEASTDNVEKLKKRAERFGTSVSKALTSIELQDRIEKRKLKFGITK